MERAAGLARIGDRILSLMAGLLALLVICYGGYSIYDDWLIENQSTSSDLMKYKPNSGSSMSLAELIAINPDVIGWIEIDDTRIDQPLTQSKKDDLEYVNKNPLGEFSVGGSCFLSVQNHGDLSDPYNLTYGHHLDNGGMYGDVSEFLEDSYFESHQTGKLYTLDKEWTIEVFAIVKANPDNAAIYSPGQYNETGVGSLDAFLRENSTHYRDIGIQTTDQIISLSTCYNSDTNGRAILFGRMVQN